MTRADALRYSRQIQLQDFDIEGQATLFESHTVIVGLGGLGCAAAQYLVAAGVGHVTLIDDDCVEESNLPRQVLHNEQRLGQRKVESAALSLVNFNSRCQIKTVSQRLADPDLVPILAKADVVLDCTDNLPTRLQLNRLCYQHRIPLVIGAAIRLEGHIVCVNGSLKSTCYACISRLFHEPELSCSESGVMSPVVGIIGATQALEAIKLVTGYGSSPINQLHHYDGLRSEWRQFQVEANPHCRVCA
ncbi:HesA/MoeB/ThiF family protein [Alteromonas oceanisediminis]|uniref:HesA/MoeB/ThiF family protein n=1 Tax=Alteromonas oceanisediminis TaxID=2836180 RepID=UPI001BD9AF6C|nr:molybdopterin-synthase adenylyltransferase MoeB [Alteromonas oceanisediminis]MBT0587374.1 molybdopterin-synthase adenylyltransferase MoeB [Alteromonas oceanisediminis]